MTGRNIDFIAAEKDTSSYRLYDAVRTKALDHIDRKLAVETKESEIQYMRFAKKALCDNSIGEWHIIQAIENGLLLPVFGAMCTFHYEGDTYMYGWDDGRCKLGLYYLPHEYYFYVANYIFISDLYDKDNFT